MKRELFSFRDQGVEVGSMGVEIEVQVLFVHGVDPRFSHSGLLKGMGGSRSSALARRASRVACLEKDT